MNDLTAIPWYRSRIIIGVVVSLVTKALALSGLVGEISSGQQEQLINAILMVAGGAGDLWALYARTQQPGAKPVTLTKAAAIAAHEQIVSSVGQVAEQLPFPAPGVYDEPQGYFAEVDPQPHVIGQAEAFAEERKS